MLNPVNLFLALMGRVIDRLAPQPKARPRRPDQGGADVLPFVRPSAVYED
jgi:hypothetical protein